MWFILLLLSLALAAPAQARKAFPTAEGYGAAETTGGSGGAVIIVNSLANNGTGTLRACMEGTGPRTCVFRIAGMINLTSAINVLEANSDLTVAGQTAPSPGVTVGPWPINIAYGAQNVIIRHLRHRAAFEEWPGNPTAPPDQNNDCGGFFLYGPNNPSGGTYHVKNVVLDHVSVGYACDDGLQMAGHVTDSTIQWSLVGENYDCHFNGSICTRDPYGSSKGFIFGSNTPGVAAVSTGSVHHNMFLQSDTRNPGGGPQGVLDWRYNIVYHWTACTGGLRLGGTDENVPGSMESHHNFVGNRYIPGPDTNTSGCWLGELRTEGNAKVYAENNVTPFCGMDTCPTGQFFGLGWGKGTPPTEYPASESQFGVSTPFSAPAVTATARGSMVSALSAGAGATVPQRDALDSRVINEMQNGSGDIGRLGAPFPFLATNTNFPADNDNDGMPNQWESDNGLNPNDSADRNFIASNGYTNLENYINQLAGDDIGGTEPPPFTPNATPIYLSAGGHSDTPTDAGDCDVPTNIATPRATLAAALACLRFPGKVLYIRGGTYAGTINTTVGPILGGSISTAPTRIEGYQAETVNIEMPVGSVNTVELSSIDNFSLSKLVINAMTRADSNALACLGSNNITITSVEFKNAFFEVGYFNGCTNVTVTSSLFHDSSNAAVVSLVTSSSNIRFQQSTFYNGPLQGIEAHSSSTNNGLVIYRSTVRNTGTASTDAAIDIGTGSGANITNNLLYSNKTGIRIRNGATGTKVYNNTIAVNTGRGILCDSGASGVEIKNTIAFGNSVANITNNCTATVATNMETDPLFANAPTDLHLLDGSAAIDNGTSIAGITEDFAGTARPQGLFFDIGAYDRAQSTPPDPPGQNVTVRSLNRRVIGLFF